MSYSGYLFYDAKTKKYRHSNLINSDTRKYLVLNEDDLGEAEGQGRETEAGSPAKSAQLGVPYAMLVISVLQIAAFMCDSQLMTEDLAFIPSKRYQIWRYMTYMFTHADALHLISNVVLQIIAGLVLESHQGVIKTLLVYFGGGIAGTLAWSSAETTVIGASSGAYALYFSQIPQVLLNAKSLSFMRIRATSLIFSVVGGSFYEVFDIFVRADSPTEVAFVSHIAGFFAGIVLGFAVYDKYYKRIRWTFCFVAFYGAVAGVVYNIYGIHVLLKRA